MGKFSKWRRKNSVILHQTSDGSVTYVKTLEKKRTPGELAEFKQEICIDDHLITLTELINRYHTDLQNGLSKAKAGDLLKFNGPNCLVPPPKKSTWYIFLEYMFGGFATLLWVGAILSFIGFGFSHYTGQGANMDQIYLGGVLIIVVIVTGTFGFLQESANVSIMDSFKKMVPKYATTIRDGQKIIVPSEELVVGDLVLVQMGDCIPADIRIIDSRRLKVDNSSITGESESQPRTSECTDANPLETANLAFYGTNVVEGTGTGVVIACGDDTMMGHIAGLTSGLKSEETPIKKEIKHFIKIITILAFSIGTLFFVISMIIGYTFFEAFVYFIAIIVANVPEGLLVTLTACLTLTAKRMERKFCLVKNLQAVETLGSTSVICSDKTGTLTQNRMSISHVFYDNTIYSILSDKNPPNKLSRTFLALGRVGILCSKATFKENQEQHSIDDRQCYGDASEIAVLKCMEKMVGNVLQQRRDNPKVCEIPFNSTNKYQLSIHVIKDESAHILVIKGAPERILDHCSTILLNEGEITLTQKEKQFIKRAVLELGYKGERVLGFADLFLRASDFPIGYPFDPEKHNFPINGLRFLGLMSMIDPPRLHVPESVSKCRTAGIRVIMVTGDHPMTAMAIARKVGIISSTSETVYDIAMKKNISTSKISYDEMVKCQAVVVTGADLRDMEDSQLENILKDYKEIVFARTSPQQKLKIVESFQNMGAIVAVTGDGVNDSPALKKADIGIAMGIAGSDVAKDAADMILLDDNFSSIVTGIEEGRLIFDNLKKSIFYVLTSNVPEIMPFIAFLLLDMPNALSIMSILLIDVGTDLWPAISLAYEKAEADIMHRKPRKAEKDKLVNSRLLLLTYCQIGMIQAFASYSCYFFIMAQHGFFWQKLIGIRKKWEAKHVNDLEDSYGQEWTYQERMLLNRKCYAGFFLAIVITQIADLVICKTRKLSIFRQGMSNWVLNLGIVFEVFLALLVVYTPGLNRVLQFEPVEWYSLLPAVPFALIIFTYDEIRRLIIRKNPGGWFERETYY